MIEMNVDPYCDEILFYSTKDSEGRYRIPIVIDFDFTCTKESSWLEGTWEENPYCFEVLRKWQKLGCVYILDTMRNDSDSEKPVQWLQKHGVVIYGVGLNPDQEKCDGATRKAWGIFSIDDRNAGTLLVNEGNKRPYIDWYKMDVFLTPILQKIAWRLPQMEEERISKRCVAYSKE